MSGSLWGPASRTTPTESPPPSLRPAPPSASPVAARSNGNRKAVAAVALAAVLGFAAGMGSAAPTRQLLAGWRPAWPSIPRLTTTAPATGAAQAQPTAPAAGGQGAQPVPPAAGPAAQPTQPAQPGQTAPPDLRRVIDQANAAQARAIASGDLTAMVATATADYYRSMVQTNQELLASGVKGIELVDVQWGPVVVRGGTATATTVETWRTTYIDGTSDQSSGRNVYTLVADGGSWKIQADDHPDDALSPSNGALPGVPANPASPSNPTSPGRQGASGSRHAPAPAPAPRGQANRSA